MTRSDNLAPDGPEAHSGPQAHLALVPRDGLFLKDGRGWYTSDVGRSHARPWPLPPTVRGALRAAYGHHLMARGAPRLAPEVWEQRTEALALRAVLTLRRPRGASVPNFEPAHRLWPIPCDAVIDERDAIHRLAPTPTALGGGLDLDQVDIASSSADEVACFQGLWRPCPPDLGKPERRPQFWTEATMCKWLAGGEVASSSGLDPAQRTDVHVTISPGTGAATPSMLFWSQITEPMDNAGHEWAVAVACALPSDPEADDFPAGPIGLGGRRRQTWAKRVDAALFAMPAGLADRLANSRGLRLTCVTPALFLERGWLPDGFEAKPEGYIGRVSGIDAELRLRAALVPRPLDLSTWNTVARAPRATLRLVAPGAVYFFDKLDGAKFTAAEHQSLWLAGLGTGRADGLGLVVPGRWDPPSA
ncbi:type III-B CRISPR module-associated Cmr3 family protein [Haliangium sp.]|uniref:type III-B CRISPR module-associated Cmr3 family protein n=1 Tax=Haliangium sp. TaxID=2663208 RepID=UPI003D0CCA71